MSRNLPPEQPNYGRGYPPPGYQQGYPSPPPPQKRRRVWPWVLLALVLVPVAIFASCTALLGGAISAVDQQRKGGSVQIGETFTYANGLAITVAAPAPYTPSNQFEVPPGEQAYEALVTVVNGTDSPVSATLITMNATVNATPAPLVVSNGAFATQDIAPGQTLALPFRFRVPEGAKGPLQIAVSGEINEPVFFNGQL